MFKGKLYFTVFKVDKGAIEAYAIKAFREYWFFTQCLGWESEEEPFYKVQWTFGAQKPTVLYPTAEKALKRIDMILMPKYCPEKPVPVVTVGRWVEEEELV